MNTQNTQSRKNQQDKDFAAFEIDDFDRHEDPKHKGQR